MPVSPLSATTASRPREDDDLPSLVPSARARTTEPPTATRRKIDGDVLAFVRNASPKAPPQPGGDGVLYVGMNDESKALEASALRGSGANVTTILRSDATTVRLDGRDHDLATDGGCRAFTRALSAKHGLHPGTATKLDEAFFELPPGGRDELARIALVLAPGERGGAVPSRLVFSGHSDGSDVHAGNDALRFSAILTLARALPNASRRIEDVHFSGCFTSAQVYAVDEWREACPNLKTLWGYAGLAPAAPLGHLRAWERSTRGRVDSDPKRGPTANVTSWSVQGGIRSGISLETLRARQPEADRLFDGLVSGASESGPWGLARGPYETYRELSHRPELTKAEQAHFGARADSLHRIRFYPGVVRELVNVHGTDIREAFESLGLEAPDLVRLSRREALERFAELETKAREARPLPRAVVRAEPAVRGLRTLDATVLLSRWCH